MTQGDLSGDIIPPDLGIGLGVVAHRSAEVLQDPRSGKCADVGILIDRPIPFELCRPTHWSYGPRHEVWVRQGGEGG